MEANSDGVEKNKKKELPSKLRKEVKKYREKGDLWKERTAIKRKQLQASMSKVKDIEESRDKWKKDAKEFKIQLEKAEQELKKTQQDLVAREKEIEIFKKKTKIIIEQEKANQEIALHHHYPISVVKISLDLIIKGIISFQATSRVFEIFQKGAQVCSSYFNFIPSWKSSYNWMLKLGLFKLTKKKEMANDWIILIDFKVQAGSQKCCVILGVRLSELMKKRENRENLCLTHEDMETLRIELMEKSSGEKVAEILEDITKEIGPAMQVIADHGGDVNKGTRIYCEAHKETINTYDITHKLACLLKSEVKDDEAWNEIITLMNDSKLRTKQSPEACLSPPRRTEKARFMNADMQIDWLEEMVYLLKEELPNFLDIKRVMDKLGWVLRFEATIKVYVEIAVIIRESRNLVRNEGLHRQSYIELFKLLRKKFSDRLSSRAFNFAKKVVDFLKVEGRRIPHGKVFLGSSEIIESLFGKYKQIEERTKATKSITASILSIAAILGSNTAEMVSEALTTISMKTIQSWREKWIGKSDLTKKLELAQI